MARVLMLASDYIGERMAGPGIRCVELGRQLVAAGHEVTIVAEGGTGLPDPALTILSQVPPATLDQVARRHDVVFLQGFALEHYPDLRRVPAPLVVDLYDPYPLALLDQLPPTGQQATYRRWNRAFRDVLRFGDYFLCASERQRDLWIGSLVAAGRINPRTWGEDPTLEHLLGVVPFGLPEEPPRRAGPGLRGTVPTITEGDTVLLWGGGIYNWFDVPTLIRALALAVERAPRLRLVFMSAAHPNPGIPPQMWMPERARALAESLGLLNTHVFFNSEWVPYDERGSWLLDADCGVSTHYDRVETRYSFRTRVLDYLWAGLPLVVTEGDGFADLVSQRRLGWVVPPEDVPALAEALVEMAGKPELRREMGERVRASAEDFRWSELARPLAAFCERPRWAADRPRRRWVGRGPRSALTIRTEAAAGLTRRALASVLRVGPRETLRRALARRRRRGSGE